MIIRLKAFVARNSWLLIPATTLLALGFGGIIPWTQVAIFALGTFFLGYLFIASLKNSYRSH